MTDKKPARPGKPFQPGDDPRRHLAGRKSKDAINFGQAFSRAIAESGDAEALARVLWKKALQGVPFAVDTILERTLGRPVQGISIAEPPCAFRILYGPKPDGHASANDEVLPDGTIVEGIFHRAPTEAELDEMRNRDNLLTQGDIDTMNRKELSDYYRKTEAGKKVEYPADRKIRLLEGFYKKKSEGSDHVKK